MKILVLSHSHKSYNKEHQCVYMWQQVLSHPGHLHLAAEISHLLYDIDNSTLYVSCTYLSSFPEHSMLAATIFLSLVLNRNTLYQHIRLQTLLLNIPSDPSPECLGRLTIALIWGFYIRWGPDHTKKHLPLTASSPESSE